METLDNFKENIFSQSGEDGVIREILKRISFQSDLNSWCCEFGAWDGLHLSNTARLIRDDDYRAVLIEGDPARIQDLEINFPQTTVIKICSFVTTVGETSLSNILAKTEIPLDFDFLSIDIDGMDYWILKSLVDFKPKLICIEFNPTVPNTVSFIQANDPKIKHGSSAKAIESLGKDMGYGVVAATATNLFLVRSDFINAVSPTLPSLDSLIPQGNDPQYLFFGYDGSVLSNRSDIRLFWHGTFPLSTLEVLPRYLKRYSGDYNYLQKILLRAFHFMHRENKIAFLQEKMPSRFQKRRS
jgi:hypothetical protein